MAPRPRLPRPPPSICARCSAAAARRRWHATAAAAMDARAEVARLLDELRRRHPGLVDAQRLQLALGGLRRHPADEPVRVAVLGLAPAPAAALLAALLADPLVDEPPWERDLAARDPERPLVVRVAPGPGRGGVVVAANDALDELHVSCPGLDGLNLEFLLTPFALPAHHGLDAAALEEAVLVPAVDVPQPGARPSPRPTPVHQALLVADGLMGAVAVAALPASDLVRAAVQLRGFTRDAPFDVVDASVAQRAVAAFRRGPQNASEYEALWSASNLSALAAWLKASAATTGHATKPAVTRLIASLLRNATSSIQTRLSRTPSGRDQGLAQPPEPPLGHLQHRLAAWAQKAHAELQDELDLAFTGRPWRKLGWWKLFWRVDDVAMLTNEMLTRRFLPTAEQELVYLAGRIAQGRGQPPHYSQPSSQQAIDAPEPQQRLPTAPASALPKWPGHIAFTRRYLQHETVPALQSLAQKLVMQSLGTSGLTTSLAALLYLSSWASSLYEAGAVAALGIVYSLGRMQKKWDAGRDYWEGEVREEGRKAVRGAEESVAAVLDADGPGGASDREAEELHEARGLVAKAESALARMT